LLSQPGEGNPTRATKVKGVVFAEWLKRWNAKGWNIEKDETLIFAYPTIIF
jgi:hypothetical protein